MKHKKKLLCIALSLIVATSAVYAAYQRPKEVQAAVVIDDAVIIAALLAACGIVYVGNQWFNASSDTAEEKYGEEIGDLDEGFRIIWDPIADEVYQLNPSMGNPNDFNSDDDNPEDKLSTWDKFKAWVKAHPQEKLLLTGTAIGAVMLKFANLLKGEREKGDYFDNGETTQVAYEKLKGQLPNYPYTLVCKYNAYDAYYFCLFDKPITLYKVRMTNIYNTAPYVTNMDANMVVYDGLHDNLGLQYSSVFEDKVVVSNDDMTVVGGNVQVSNSYTKPTGTYDVEKVGVVNTDTTKISSGIQKNENDEIVSLPVQQINAGALAQNWTQLMTSLQNALSTGTDTDVQSAVDAVVDTVGQTQTDTDTGTDTGTGTDTLPGLGTLPDVETEAELDGDMFLLPEEITEKFPFCVPFDIIRAFSVLESSSRAAPKITLPLKAERYDINYELDIDLSVFDEVAALLRNLELILFVVGLALVSRDLIKG